MLNKTTSPCARTLAVRGAPVIGYEKAAALAKEAYTTGRTIREVAREKSGLSDAELDRLLDPATQTGER